MFDLLAVVSWVSCSVWGQRSPGGQVCFEVSAMLFGGQPLRPPPRRGSWELLLLGKMGFRGRVRLGLQGLVQEAGAKLVCNAVGGPGGGAARGHGHQHLGMSWGEEAGLEASRGADTGPGARAGRPARRGCPTDPACRWPQRAPRCWELLGLGGVCTTLDTCQ